MAKTSAAVLYVATVADLPALTAADDGIVGVVRGDTVGMLRCWDGTTWSTTIGGTSATILFNALSPLTTLGDLLVRGVTLSERLPVGTTGQDLVPDPSSALGVSWQTTMVGTVVGQTTSNTTPTDLPGLSIPIQANRKYAFDIHIISQSSVNSEANYFSVNGPAGPTQVNFSTIQATSNNNVRADHFNAYDSANGLTQGFVSAVPTFIRGTLTNGSTAGSLSARFWTETGGAETVTTKGGCWMRVTEIP